VNGSAEMGAVGVEYGPRCITRYTGVIPADRECLIVSLAVTSREGKGTWLPVLPPTVSSTTQSEQRPRRCPCSHRIRLLEPSLL
jgi:hypothetical protein